MCVLLEGLHQLVQLRTLCGVQGSGVAFSKQLAKPCPLLCRQSVTTSQPPSKRACLFRGRQLLEGLNKTFAGRRRQLARRVENLLRR
jgi:hypothetical protein